MKLKVINSQKKSNVNNIEYIYFVSFLNYLFLKSIILFLIIKIQIFTYIHFLMKMNVSQKHNNFYSITQNDKKIEK